MPLEPSGFIAIGGTATNRSINLELGRAQNATSSLGESALRTLAGVPSGPVVLPNDFWGKSNRSFSLAGVASLVDDNLQGSPGNTYTYYQFYANGDLLGFTSFGAGATVNTDWTLPLSSGIGSSYWVRWTIVSQSGSGFNVQKIGTNGVWQSLGTSPAYGWQTNNNNSITTRFSTSYFEISSDNVGSNILATSPTINLDISVSV